MCVGLTLMDDEPLKIVVGSERTPLIVTFDVILRGELIVIVLPGVADVIESAIITVLLVPFATKTD